MSIEEIFNKVADELPHGYTIRISLKNGYGEAVLEKNGEFFRWFVCRLCCDQVVKS